MSTDIVEIEVVQPGRAAARFEPTGKNGLRLIEIIRPKETLPGDLAILPTYLDTAGEPVQVLLLGSFSYPPGTLIPGRLIGGIRLDHKDPILLAVPVMDITYDSIEEQAGFPESMIAAVGKSLKGPSMNNTELQFASVQDLKAYLKDSYLRHRLLQAEIQEKRQKNPFWQPTQKTRRVADYLEADHYTEAEYTFYQLPYHFQEYVQRYLANDERILYALQRPALKSIRTGQWFSRETLQQSVLLLTTQRLFHLVELVPLGDSGVRYGYDAHMGVLEKLEDVSIEPLQRNHLILRTRWGSKHGHHTVEWEFPDSTEKQLEKAVELLRRFVPFQKDSLALQRAWLPEPQEPLPDLTDPAANDPEEIRQFQDRFLKKSNGLLGPQEKIYAWALRPAWFENTGYPDVLIITRDRLLMVTETESGVSIRVSINIADMTTLGYKSSLIQSEIHFSVASENQVQQVRIEFPYSAEKAFFDCFEAVRKRLSLYQ